MRINALITNFLVNRSYNNQNNYCQPFRHPVLLTSKPDTFERVAFTGDGPESVNPSRKVFDTLPQDKLTCPCCGRVMIPPSEIEELKNSHALNCSALEAVGVLSKYENNLHAVEKEIFQMLRREAIQNPDMNFKDILNKWKPLYENQLVQTQFGVFALIEKASENIDEDKRKKIDELIENEKVKITNGNNEFRRKFFVKKFEEIFEDTEDSADKEHLIRLAKKLPTAYEDKNAFIVKYSARSAEEIGIRLLSYSMRTIEHVKPKNKDGENHLFNYIPECMRCNSFRQDRPMIQQLEEYPEMFANSQKLMDTMIGFANSGKLSKWYILKIQERIYDESDGVLKLDISKLKMTSRMKTEYSRLLEREGGAPSTKYYISKDTAEDIKSKKKSKKEKPLGQKTKKEQKREKVKVFRNKKSQAKKSEMHRK